MGKSDYQKLHHELWQWLADNPDEEKQDWPKWKFNGGEIEKQNANCFACEYFKDCDECELNENEIAISGINMCQDDNSIYKKWHFSSDKKQRTKLALYIKDLW